MDEEFTDFKSGDPVHDIDLLDMTSNSKIPTQDPPPPKFSFSFSEGVPKIPALKKKSFIFPLDLELNTTNLLEIITTETKPTPWSLIENIEGLESQCKFLVDKGRLSQALRCKKHAETLGEIQKIKETKRIATERSDYETAIRYRNIISQLEKQLSTVEEIEDWLKEYKETTLQDLCDQIVQEQGEGMGRVFKSKFIFPEIKKSTDIELAQGVMSQAQQYTSVKHILNEQPGIFQTQSKLILNKINEELCKAMGIIFKIKPLLPTMGKDEDLQVYLKALPEVFFVAERLQKVIQLVGIEKEFKEILAEIQLNWDEIKDLVCKVEEKIRYETGESVCGICLFANKGLAMLCSSYFHVTCINFWINRVSVEPPQLVLGNNFN